MSGPGDPDDLFGEEEGGRRSGGGLSDIMRKAVSAGIGAVFLTEESVRAYVAESKLPRDIAKYVIQTTGTAKEQFFQYLSKEVSQMIRRTDLPKVITAFLQGHEIEVQAKIRFRPTGEPEVTEGSARAVPGKPGAAEPPPEAAEAAPDAASEAAPGAPPDGMPDDVFGAGPDAEPHPDEGPRGL